MTTGSAERPVALVTGAGRRRGISTAVARRLAETGWDVAFTHFGAYDARMPWGMDAGAAGELMDHVRAAGARSCSVEADFADVTAAQRVFGHVGRELGPVGALVLGTVSRWTAGSWTLAWSPSTGISRSTRALGGC
jgi:3-oxoacyl-[acyl-carrier protein] reductase